MRLSTTCATLLLVLAAAACPAQEIDVRVERRGETVVVKAYASTTSISSVAASTRIVHHGEYVSAKWLPPMIGPAVIERETRRQYEEFIAEIEPRMSAKR